MNNLFKSNSRFAALADETEDKKKDNNSKKKDNDNKQKNNNLDNRLKEKETNIRFNDAFVSKEIEAPRERNQFRKPIALKVEPAIVVKPVINVDDFTTSLSKSTTAIQKEKKPTLSFAEKALHNCNIGEIIKFSHIEKPKPKPLTDEEMQNKIKEQQMAYNVLNGLCDLYEKRTSNYIERYGYYVCERTFKFQGWEEEEVYNQKLEDDYDEWLEKEEEKEHKQEEEKEREEYLANNDRYVNYWKYY